MFAIGDKVICIFDTDRDFGLDLISGNEYTILTKRYNKLEGVYYHRISSIAPFAFNENLFVTPLEYRRIKLLKLKERICLNMKV